MRSAMLSLQRGTMVSAERLRKNHLLKSLACQTHRKSPQDGRLGQYHDYVYVRCFATPSQAA